MINFHRLRFGDFWMKIVWGSQKKNLGQSLPAIWKFFDQYDIIK